MAQKRNFVISHDDLGLININKCTFVELSDKDYGVNMTDGQGNEYSSVADIAVEGWDVNDGGDGELNTWSAKEVVVYLEFSKLSKP